jgi:hypothetical protein
LLPPRGFEDPHKTSLPSRRTSWLLPPSGFEDPRKTSLSSPPPFRLSQSLCISPPIVHRPFEFPLLLSYSSLFSLSILRRTCIQCLSVSHLVVVFSLSFSVAYPTSLCLALRYFRYPLSPVLLSCQYQSIPPSFPLILPGIPAFHLSSFVFLVFECTLRVHILWFNPHQLSLSSASAFSILANRLSQLNLSSLYLPSFLCNKCPLPPSIHPSTLFVASTSFLDCSGFLPPFHLWFLAVSPIAGWIRGLFICLGVTSP